MLKRDVLEKRAELLFRNNDIINQVHKVCKNTALEVSRESRESLLICQNRI